MPAAPVVSKHSGWLGKKVATPTTVTPAPAKQRVLTEKSVGHPAYATPGLTGGRSSSSSSQLAGSSRVKVEPPLKQSGLGAYFAPTPPTTGPQPRGGAVNRLKSTSGASRGSPISQTAETHTKRALGKPSGSSLAVKKEEDEYYKSDAEEDDDVEEIADIKPIAGSSRLRRSTRDVSSSKTSKVLRPKAQGPLAKSRQLFTFSSGELTPPPESDIEQVVSEHEEIGHFPSSPAKPIPVPAARRNAHLDVCREVDMDDSQPNLTQAEFSQVPLEVLSAFRRMNGMNPDLSECGQSEGYKENAERTRVMNEAKAMAGEKGRLAIARASAEGARQEDIEVRAEKRLNAIRSPAKGRKGRQTVTIKTPEKEDQVGGVLEDMTTPGGGLKSMSPLRINTLGLMKRNPPASPSPCKSVKKRRLNESILQGSTASASRPFPTPRFAIHQDAPITIVDEIEELPVAPLVPAPAPPRSMMPNSRPASPPGPVHASPEARASPIRGTPVLVQAQPVQPRPLGLYVDVFESAPDSIAIQLRGELDPILAAAERDARERDAERARLAEPLPPGAESHPHSDPPRDWSPEIESDFQPPSSFPYHHSVTPPKKSARSPKQDHSLLASLPSAQASFSLAPWRAAEETQGLRLDVAGETLATWSVSGSQGFGQEQMDAGHQSLSESITCGVPVDASVLEAEEDLGRGAGAQGEAIEENQEGEAARAEGPESAPIEDAPAVFAVAEETQSIPATQYSYSFPKFFPSQIEQAPRPSSSPIAVPAAVPVPTRPAPRLSSGWASLSAGILAPPPISATPLVPATPPPPVSKTKRKPRVSAPSKASNPTEQTKLDMFGIMKAKPTKRAREFEDDFENEVGIEEEAPPTAEAGPGPSTAKSRKKKGGLKEVPDAPYHPSLRPAGIRAMKAREKASAADGPRTRARTRTSDTSSSSPVPGSDRATPRPAVSKAKQKAELVPLPSPPSGPSMMSSSVLTDSTEDAESQGMSMWFRGMEGKER